MNGYKLLVADRLAEIWRLVTSFGEGFTLAGITDPEAFRRKYPNGSAYLKAIRDLIEARVADGLTLEQAQMIVLDYHWRVDLAKLLQERSCMHNGSTKAS